MICGSTVPPFGLGCKHQSKHLWDFVDRKIYAGLEEGLKSASVLRVLRSTSFHHVICLVVEPPTPLKNNGVKVSWDDDIPNIWKNKENVPNHKPEFEDNQLEWTQELWTASKMRTHRWSWRLILFHDYVDCRHPDFWCVYDVPWYL